MPMAPITSLAFNIGTPIKVRAPVRSMRACRCLSPWVGSAVTSSVWKGCFVRISVPSPTLGSGLTSPALRKKSSQWATMQRNDEIRDNVTRMLQEWEAQRGALATVRRFNATLSAKGHVWFWPEITAALTSKHHWLVIACDSCDSVVDLDLRVKPRDQEASIRVALRDVQCPRCNGHGRPRIIALARHASV